MTPVVSVTQPTIICDNCGYVYTTTSSMEWATTYSGIEFHPARPITDQRRMCRECRIRAGWPVSRLTAALDASVDS